MAETVKLAGYLDKLLRIEAFSDTSHNGLQVQNSGKAARVACGVDADLSFFKAAREHGADFLLVHHGLSWGDSLKRITALNYERIAYLVQNEMALYAAHLPLDAHSRYGNNILLCRALGLKNCRPFGSYHGQTISYRGELARACSFDSFCKVVREKINKEIRTMPFGKAQIKRIAVVSGGAGAEMLAEAAAEGVDVFLSGEATLAAWGIARDMGIHAVFAGHYATETLGVNALARHIRQRFKISAEFIGFDVPY